MSGCGFDEAQTQYTRARFRSLASLVVKMLSQAGQSRVCKLLKHNALGSLS